MPMYQEAAWSVGQAAVAAGTCPEYEELSAFLDELLTHEAHQRVERHISACELCSRDVETLQAARSRASLAPRITVHPGQFVPRRPWTISVWQKVAAVSAVGAAAVVAAMMLTHPHPQGSRVNIAQTPPKIVREVPAKTGATPTADSQGDKPAPFQPVPPKSPKPEFVAVLHDGSVTVVRADGKLLARSDGKDLEAQIAALVKEKLRRGKVPPSFQMAKADQLRGPVDQINVEKLSPAPGGLTEPRPVFRWEPVEGASKYRVEVYKFDGTPVLSAETETTIYQPDKRLPTGGYKWVVRPRRGELAEWEISKAAAFRILSNKEINLISRAKREYAGSHLVLGTVYESLGLEKEAVREFRYLAAASPKSRLAARLLAGAESKLKE